MRIIVRVYVCIRIPMTFVATADDDDEDHHSTITHDRARGERKSSLQSLGIDEQLSRNIGIAEAIDITYAISSNFWNLLESREDQIDADQFQHKFIIPEALASCDVNKFMGLSLRFSNQRATRVTTV